IAILLHIFLAFLFLFMAPFILYRKIIFHSSKIFRPDLGKMLTLESVGLYSRHDPITAEIVGESVVRCHVAVEDFRRDFRERVLDRRRADVDLAYPELGQNITTWM